MVFPMLVILLFLTNNYDSVGALAFAGGTAGTLTGYADPPGPGRTLLVEATSDGAARNKRSTNATTTADTSDSPVETKINYLYDGHKQLMVHWVGEGSNVIICLAKDPPPTNANATISPSAVYISYDYGDKYENKTELFKLKDGGYATVDKFYNHPVYNTHFIFSDVEHKVIYVTYDYGKTIMTINLKFTPSEIVFDEEKPHEFLVLDKKNEANALWFTDNFGKTWTSISWGVKSFHWVKRGQSKDLVIQRISPSTLTNIVKMTAPFRGSPVTESYANNVVDMFVKGEYMFYTMKNKKESMDLFVSHNLGESLHCVFDTELDLKDYHIVDITNSRALVAVSHSNTVSHLYVSEDLHGTDGKVRFTLSLESVLCYFPNSTWNNSWLFHVTNEAFADVYKVEGMTGIYIASQVTFKPSGGNLGPQHLASRITYDHGFTWRTIMPPTHDIEGQPTSCGGNCSLHLSQRFNQLYPESRAITILSSKSAPGIIIATGVIGKSLKGHFGVYISTDAGITWRQTLRELYFFNMGDHGGIQAAVKYFKSRGETRHILYSTDEGENWNETQFHNEEIRLYGLMTEPGENTTVFTMFGSNVGQHRWIIVKVDFKKVFKYNCTNDDYKLWSPRSSIDNHRLVPCVMGQQRTYRRRIPHANCYNGLDFSYDLPVTMEPCECDKVDFECDYGFVKTGNPWHCVKNNSVNDDLYKMPNPCPEGTTYNRTKGYRKIPGGVCYNGDDSRYLPDVIHCPSKPIPNMLIFAQRDKIVRMKLPSGEQEVMNIPNLKNVIAIDFNLKNHCLYWADIVKDNIARLCEDGKSPPEVLLSSDLVSVEGMALDWVSNNLYFVDGLRAKIELIRVDVQYPGRMRRTILSAPELTKPRGIAVHPVAGYLFWTDWANKSASVKRSNLDGTSIITIAFQPVVEWPNGITIDYIAERVYWVDAKLDYIGSSGLDGSSFKQIPIPADYVAHPFSVAVFKDDLYWDDWKKNAIYMVNKDHGGHVGQLVDYVSGLMDLKVIAHGVQEGTNPCANSTCAFICVGKPEAPHFTCLCPDSMQDINGECMCPGGLKPFGNNTCPQVNGTCSTSHFKCANGNCIPNVWKCNNEDDCGDNSDEMHCDMKTCEVSHFTCGDGKCIPRYWKCDREVDCSDGSDELDCPNKECNSTTFQCANGRCISKKYYCDGEDDCKDGSDEKGCEPVKPENCRKDEFKCRGGAISCIPMSWKCDGEADCLDQSDETGCANATCPNFKFNCGGEQNKCIYISWVCDGDKDCDNGADEKNCTTTSPATTVTPTPLYPFQPSNGQCQPGMFKCNNDKCVPIWWKCDGANDCIDGSDEEGCGIESPTPIPQPTSPLPHVCSHNQFQCASGECIAISWVCDKSKDCMDGDDEAHCEGALACDHVDEFKCKVDGSCIHLHQVCNGQRDCPDGSDESICNWRNYTGPPTPSCSLGYFPCDIKKCLPLASMCDGHRECLDGTDENNCNGSSRIYQVLQMGVDERRINDTEIFLYWWMPMPDGEKLEFLPSISSLKTGVWQNKTWTVHNEYRFDGLEPYTEYNMTVYTRVNGSNTVFLPAKYYTASTGEGIPSSPWNLTVVQKNGSSLLISWNKPVQPNGVVQTYEICRSPPLIKLKLSDNSTSHLLTGDFYPGTKYSFYVIAYNGKHHSERSEVRLFEFNDDFEMEPIKHISVSHSADNKVSLSWKYEKPVDGFIIETEIEYPYPKLLPHITPNPNITIGNLAPGVLYTFKVSAYKNVARSSITEVDVNTPGTPLPELLISELKVQPNGTSIKVSWNEPKDPRKANWVYGVYYGLTEDETLEKSRINTTKLSTIIHDLNACEKYIITVGLIEPLGVGPITRNPPSVLTQLNTKAPPKKVSVQQAPDNHLQMLVQWSPSCPGNTSIGYLIDILEKTSNHRSMLGITSSGSQESSRIFNVTYGGVYEVRIRTRIENSTFSPTITYKAPPIMPPYEIHVFFNLDGHLVVYWQERVIPTIIGAYHYEVLVCEGSEFNETIAQVYKVQKPPFIFMNNTASMYSFAVRMTTEKGYKSIISEVDSITNKSSSWSDKITNSNLTSILVPVCLLLVLLGGALGFYVIKYRRLQNSFIRFANSHYDTRSEAATFDDNVLDEDDSPQIRGFSDDEPLVIA